MAEGLYQGFGSRHRQCKFAVPASDGAYGSKDQQLTKDSHTAVSRVIDAPFKNDFIKSEDVTHQI